MIKLIYSLVALLVSSAMYLFTTGKQEVVCNNSITGIVKVHHTDRGDQLVIESDDHQLYFPRIENADVVIVAGTRIKACYDKLNEHSDAHVIQINGVVRVP